jgi:hypothetical protein
MSSMFVKERHSKCPIPNTHSRLEQAHRLWHQMLENYDDPEGFRANLNSTIEALRNVTFMLQKEESAVPGFDAWYAERQAEMKADVIMKWLQNARTTVVHKSDLKTQSTAHAAIHNNLTQARFVVEAPPLAATPVVARSIATKLPEPFASSRQNLVLSVERRWSVPELPDRELLDALAYAYGMLSQIVRAAHERVGAPYDQRSPHDEPVTVPDGRLPCMITTAEDRTARVTLADYQPLILKTEDAQYDPSMGEKAAKRYSLTDSDMLRAFPDDPLAFAQNLIPVAKRMLAKDKYHNRLAFLHTPSGWRIVELNAQDRPGKYALAQLLAQMVRRYQADAVVEIGEAWMSPLRELNDKRMPEHAPGRQEALIVSVASSQGLCWTITAPFRRTILGRIKFYETEVTEVVSPHWLASVFEVWNLPLPSVSEHADPI